MVVLLCQPWYGGNIAINDAHHTYKDTAGLAVTEPSEVAESAQGWGTSAHFAVLTTTRSAHALQAVLQLLCWFQM
jgi:hypothetical protein